jgi:hypothetical protein
MGTPEVADRLSGRASYDTRPWPPVGMSMNICSTLRSDPGGAARAVAPPLAGSPSPEPTPRRDPEATP